MKIKNTYLMNPSNVECHWLFRDDVEYSILQYSQRWMYHSS